MSASVRLLGAPRIDVGGVVHEPAASRASALLYVLARSRDWTQRGDLCFLFWPDSPHEHALSNLRQVVRQVRTAPYALGLEIERGRPRWQVDTDLPHPHQLAKGPVWGPVEYQRAPRFMDGFWLRNATEFDTWLDTEREYWEARLRDDLVSSVDRAMTRGDAAHALSLLASWLRHHPLDDGLVHRALVICRQAGKVDEGERHYRAFAAALEDDLGLAPSTAITAARDALVATAPVGEQGHAGALQLPEQVVDRSDRAPRPTAARATDGLDGPTVPARYRRTPFFGRELELALIRDALAGSRGATFAISGAGGMGKSRLAFEAALSLRAAFGGDVAFVSLANVTSRTAATATIERALASGAATGGTGTSGLKVLLEGRAPLLALDDVEAFDGVEEWLEDLHSALPSACWLVTSRLRVAPPSAAHVSLEGLPHGAADDGPGPSASVALFEDRLRRVDPVGAGRLDRDAVEELVTLVGGMPLALEIAANVAASFSLGNVLARLRSTPDLDAPPGTDLEPRHATVRAVFESTWRGLSESQRETLGRMTVFRDGCDLAAAEAVADLHLSMVAGLRDSSMLSFSRAGRVVQHPLIERFTRERVARDGHDLTDVVERHAHYYLRLLEDMEHAGAEGSGDATDRLRVEHANLEAAWAWALAAGEWRPLGAGRHTLRQSYFYAGREERYWQLVEGAVATVPRDHPTWALLAALLGERLEDLGRVEDGLRLKHMAVQAARASGHGFALAWSLLMLGQTASADEPLRGRPAFAEADALLEAMNEVRLRAVVLGRLVLQAETWEERAHWLHVGEPVRAALGSPVMNAEALTARARDLSDRYGRHSEALSLLEEAVRLVRHSGISEWSDALSELASMHARIGDFEACRYLAEEALRLIEPYDRSAAWIHMVLAHCHLAEGDLARAREHAGYGDLAYLRTQTLVQVALAEGNVREARSLLEAAHADVLAGRSYKLVRWLIYQEDLRLLDVRVSLAEGRGEHARSLGRAALRALQALQAAPFELRAVLAVAPVLEQTVRDRATLLVASHPGSLYVDRRAALAQLPVDTVVLPEDARRAEQRFDGVVDEVLAALA